MQQDLILVKINSEYCDYLRKFDSKVPYNYATKKIRPFVGILFNIGSIKYFAPLSSPKPKHLKLKNSIDFLKIKNGKLGVINFNNMIPVNDNNYIKIDLDNIANDKQYYNLLNEQLVWLNRHKKIIYNNSFVLYTKFINHSLSDNIRMRCCDFELLEKKCLEFNKEIVNN